jgi:hypothetical protein
MSARADYVAAGSPACNPYARNKRYMVQGHNIALTIAEAEMIGSALIIKGRATTKDEVRPDHVAQVVRGLNALDLDWTLENMLAIIR